MSAGHRKGHEAICISDTEGEQITEEKLKKLFKDVKDLPVAIYSIAGAFRKGNTFMLNLFIKYLTWLENSQECSSDWMETESETVEGFSWRGGMDPDTQGILIYSRYFVLKDREGVKVAVFLMDTQGLFDHKTSMTKCTAIFALSTLISSVQIYNLSQQIQAENLLYLQLFTNYARVMKSSKSQDVTRVKPFQDLWFLIRDWQHSSQGFGLEGGKNVLKKCLDPDEDDEVEFLAVRKNIKKSFENVFCYLLPYPGPKVAQRSDESTRLLFGDMETPFKQYVNAFVKNLFSPEKLVVKRIGGKVATGQNVTDFILSMISQIQSGSLPEIKNIFESTAEQVAIKVLAECERLAEEGFKKKLGHEAVCISDTEREQITEEKLKKLFKDVKDLPVAIYSIAGAFRKGKSFMLNLFIKYLTWLENSQECSSDWMETESETVEGFSWRGGMDPDTQGILIFSRYFVLKDREGAKVAVFLMDTQGLFDHKTSMTKCTAIFALSTLISSVQIYNLSQQIQADNLQYLQLFTNYARVMKSSKSQDVTRVKPFQDLWFLIRDWQHSSQGFGLEGGKNVLKKCLDPDEDDEVEFLAVRKNIKKSFENVFCYLLPYPGPKVAQRSDESTRLLFGDMEIPFKQYVNAFVMNLFSPEKLVVKRIGGKVATGQNVTDFILSMIAQIQSGSLPEIKNIFESTAEQVAIKVLAECEHLAEEGFKKKLMAKVCYTNDELSSAKMEVEKEILDIFESRLLLGSDTSKTNAYDKLKQIMKRLFYDFKQENSNKLDKLRRKYEKYVEDASEKYARRFARKQTNPELFKMAQADEAHSQISKDVIDEFQTQHLLDMDARYKKEYTERLKKCINEKFVNLSNQYAFQQIQAKQKMEEIVAKHVECFKNLLKEFSDDADFKTRVQDAKAIVNEDFNNDSKSYDARFVASYRKKLKGIMDLEEKTDARYENEKVKALRKMHENLTHATQKYKEMQKAKWNRNLYLNSGELHELHEECRSFAEASLQKNLSKTETNVNETLMSKLEEFYQEQKNNMEFKNESTKKAIILKLEQLFQRSLEVYRKKAKKINFDEIDEDKFSEMHETNLNEVVEIFKNENLDTKNLEYDKQKFLDKLKISVDEQHCHEFKAFLRNKENMEESIASLASTCFYVYRENMTKKLQQPVAANWVEEFHSQARDNALHQFDQGKGRNGPYKQQKREELTEQIDGAKSEYVSSNKDKQNIANEIASKHLGEAQRTYQANMAKICSKGYVDETVLSENHNRCQKEALKQFKDASDQQSLYRSKHFEANLVVAIQCEWTTFQAENKKFKKKCKVDVKMKQEELLLEYGKLLTEKAKEHVEDEEFSTFAANTEKEMLEKFDKIDCKHIEDFFREARTRLQKDLKSEFDYQSVNVQQQMKSKLETIAEKRANTAAKLFEESMEIVHSQYFVKKDLDELLKTNKERAVQHYVENTDDLPKRKLGKEVQKRLEENLNRQTLKYRKENSRTKEQIDLFCAKARLEACEELREKLEANNGNSSDDMQKIAYDAATKVSEAYQTQIRGYAKRFNTLPFETETTAKLNKIRDAFTTKKEKEASELQAKVDAKVTEVKPEYKKLLKQAFNYVKEKQELKRLHNKHLQEYLDKMDSVSSKAKHQRQLKGALNEVYDDLEKDAVDGCIVM